MPYDQNKASCICCGIDMRMIENNLKGLGKTAHVLSAQYYEMWHMADIDLST